MSNIIIKTSSNSLLETIHKINTKYVLIIKNNFYGITNYRYLKNDFFKKHILQILSTNQFLGYWFLSQNVDYGEFYNICIYDNNKLIKFIKKNLNTGRNKNIFKLYSNTNY